MRFAPPPAAIGKPPPTHHAIDKAAPTGTGTTLRSGREAEPRRQGRDSDVRPAARLEPGSGHGIRLRRPPGFGKAIPPGETPVGGKLPIAREDRRAHAQSSSASSSQLKASGSENTSGNAACARFTSIFSNWS